MRKIKKNTKFEEWLKEKRWSMMDFSKEIGISYPVIVKIMHQKGTVNLDTALIIENATGGKLSVWDLSPNAELIRKSSIARNLSNKKRKENQKKNA